MNINHSTAGRPTIQKAPTKSAKADSRAEPAAQSQEPVDKSFVRRFAEGAGGVVNAALSIPRAVIPAVVLGGMEGLDRLDPETDSVTDEQIGRYYAYAGAAQSVALAGAMGIVAGPAAAAGMVAAELPREAAGLVPFIKGGGAAQVGAQLSDAVAEAVTPEDSKFDAVKKGSWAALKSAVAEAAKVRYQEGKGMISGMVDGGAPLWSAITSDSEGEEKSTTEKVLSTTQKVLNAPAHFIQGSMQGYDAETEWGKWDFLKTRAGSLAVIGLTAGMFVGAPVAATAIGAGVALASRVFDNDEELEQTIADIGEATQELHAKNPTFADPIAQTNHLGMEAGFVAVAKTLQ